VQGHSADRPGRAFRERALERLVAKLGPPEVVPVTPGALYRWILRRPHGLDMYITLDSPEIPDLAHLIVSDPRSGAADPVASITMHTLAEVDAVIDRVLAQWKRGMP
jgi:hypothetical protein